MQPNSNRNIVRSGYKRKQGRINQLKTVMFSRTCRQIWSLCVLACWEFLKTSAEPAAHRQTSWPAQWLSLSLSLTVTHLQKVLNLHYRHTDISICTHLISDNCCLPLPFPLRHFVPAVCHRRVGILSHACANQSSFRWVKLQPHQWKYRLLYFICKMFGTKRYFRNTEKRI